MKCIKSNNNLKSVKIDVKNDSRIQSLKNQERGFLSNSLNLQIGFRFVSRNRLVKIYNISPRDSQLPTNKTPLHLNRKGFHLNRTSTGGDNQMEEQVMDQPHVWADQKHKHTAQRNIQPRLRGKALPLKRKGRFDRNGDRNFRYFLCFGNSHFRRPSGHFQDVVPLNYEPG